MNHSYERLDAVLLRTPLHVQKSSLKLKPEFVGWTNLVHPVSEL